MLEVIQQAFSCVMILVLMGLLGFVLERRGWFPQDVKTVWPKLVIVISVPPYLFSYIFKTFTRDDLLPLLYGSVAPAVSIVVTFFIGLALSRLIGVQKGRRGIFCAGFPTSNTMFMGIPVNIALFGEAALPYVLLYYFANTILFWTLGNYLISLDGQKAPVKFLSPDLFKKIFSPPILGFFVGTLTVLLNLNPPMFLLQAATYVGGLTTPMAIMFIGITIAAINFKTLKLNRDILVLMAGRFIICPLSIILVMRLFDLPVLMAKVFIIQASLPMMTGVALVAAYHQADTEYASTAVSISTLASIITIPLYMIFLSLYYPVTG